MKIALAATAVIGVLAHMFCYTNVLFAHDNAALYWSGASWASAAAGSRWLTPLWQAVTACVTLPWLEGVIVLAVCGVSAWLICEVLEIRDPVPVVLVSGLVIASPAIISTHMYLSSAHQFVAALLFACLAPYLFEKGWRGKVGTLVCLLVSLGSYAAYLSLAITLFLMRGIVRILTGREKNPLQTLREHLCYLALCGVSLLATVGIMQMLLQMGGQNAQDRVEAVLDTGRGEYLGKIAAAVEAVIDYYSPLTDGGSYFQDHKPVYLLFLLCGAVCALVCLWWLIRRRLWRQPLLLLILLIDAACLPLGMNVIGVMYESHALMQFAYIMPWVFFLQVAQALCRDEETCAWAKAAKVREAALTGFVAFCLVVEAVTIGNGVLLANVSYMKEYTLYESGISLTNRVVDRIEAIPGYVPGETRVIFVGDTREHYAPYREGFAMTDSLTGVGTSFWDTGITFNYVLKVYIQQYLGVDMDILTGQYFVHAGTVERALRAIGLDWADEAPEMIASLEDYPAQDCYCLRDGYLIFKFSDEIH